MSENKDKILEKVKQNMNKASTANEISEAFENYYLEFRNNVETKHGINSDLERDLVKEQNQKKEDLINKIVQKNYEQVRYIYTVFVVLTRTLSWEKRKIIEDRYLQKYPKKEIMKELPDPSRDFVVRQGRKGANVKKISREINKNFKDIDLNFSEMAYPQYDLEIYLKTIPTENEIDRLKNISELYWGEMPEYDTLEKKYKPPFEHLDINDIHEVIELSTDLSTMLDGMLFSLIYNLEKIKSNGEAIIKLFKDSLTQYIPEGRKRAIRQQKAKDVSIVLWERFVNKKSLSEIADKYFIYEDTCTRYIRLANDFFWSDYADEDEEFSEKRINFLKGIIDYYNLFYFAVKDQDIMTAIKDYSSFRKYMNEIYKKDVY